MKAVAVISQSTPDQINSTIGANLSNVIRWSTPVACQSLGLGSAVTVKHNLGAIPNAIHVEPYVDSRWWADQDDRKTWTATTVTLHTSHAGIFVVRAGTQ